MATRGRPPKQVLAASILTHGKTELPTRSRREEAGLRSEGLQATGGAEAVPGLQQVPDQEQRLTRAPTVCTRTRARRLGSCRPQGWTVQITRLQRHRLPRLGGFTSRDLAGTQCPRERGSLEKDALSAPAGGREEEPRETHPGTSASPGRGDPRPTGRAAHTPASASGCRLRTPSSALDRQVHAAKHTLSRSLHPIPKADNTLPAAGTGHRGTDARLTGEWAPAATHPRLTFHTQHVFRGLMGKSPPAETPPGESRKGLQVRGHVGKTVALSPGRSWPAGPGHTAGAPGERRHPLFSGSRGRGEGRPCSALARPPHAAAHGCQEEVGATGHSWDRPRGLWRKTGDSSGHERSTESAAHGSWGPCGRSSAPASNSKGPSQGPARGQHGPARPLHQGWRRGCAHGGRERSGRLPHGDNPAAPSRQVHSEMLTTYEHQEHKLLGNTPNNRQRPGQKRSRPRIPRQTLQTVKAEAGVRPPQKAPRAKAAGPGGPARLRQRLSRRTRDRRTAGPPPTWLEEAGQGLAGPEGQGSTAALSVEEGRVRAGGSRYSPYLTHTPFTSLMRRPRQKLKHVFLQRPPGAERVLGPRGAGAWPCDPQPPAEAEAPQAEEGGAGPTGAGRSGGSCTPAGARRPRSEGGTAAHGPRSTAPEALTTREFVFTDVDSPSRDTCGPQPSSTRQSPTGPLGRCPTPAPRSEALFPQKCRLLPVTSTQGPGCRETCDAQGRRPENTPAGSPAPRLAGPAPPVHSISDAEVSNEASVQGGQRAPEPRSSRVTSRSPAAAVLGSTGTEGGARRPGPPSLSPGTAALPGPPSRLPPRRFAPASAGTPHTHLNALPNLEDPLPGPRAPQGLQHT
ncbi:unnamed protein product [Nyctereutes procyonoides]|uniref:(raccoon dog) hypothetical protein n=1 Tax=Nyctereutes procyonoides TaxID=34880 RepID=A0A811ZD08_NYCPR|nr:unnamed protein product [Nyctereutes procyonoides]